VFPFWHLRCRSWWQLAGDSGFGAAGSLPWPVGEELQRWNFSRGQLDVNVQINLDSLSDSNQLMALN
jgi:hypothetical protein